MATAGKTQEAKRACTGLQPSAAHSPQQSWTRTVPAGMWAAESDDWAQRMAYVQCSRSLAMLRLLWGPVRMANAEGSRRWGGGLMSRVQPTAECLPVPPELVPETTRRKDATLRIPAATC